MIKLPEDFDPYLVLEAGSKDINNINISYNDIYKISKSAITQDKINFLKSCTDYVFSPNFLLGGINSILSFRERDFLTFMIEFTASNLQEVEESICSLIISSFAINNAITTNKFIILCPEVFAKAAIRGIWGYLSKNRPLGKAFCDSINVEYGNLGLDSYVIKKVGINVQALVLNLFMMNDDLSESEALMYLKNYSTQRFSLDEEPLYGLLDLRFRDNVPFFGGYKIEYFFKSPANTQKFFLKKYKTYSRIDSIADYIGICSKAFGFVPSE